MLGDDQLSGDLLLVGLVIADHVDGEHGEDRLTIGRVARQAFPQKRWRRDHIRRVLEDDARTYKPPEPAMWPAPCTAPMVRRPGQCGRGASSRGWLTDWSTGEQWFDAACARHSDWFWSQNRANQAARPKRLVLPPANHGGVLAKHLPELDWRAMWRWATRDTWVEHPEVEPWRPPTFTLVLGDGRDDAEAARPVLGLVPR